MDLSAGKNRILKDAFGFDRFRPGQEAVVDAVLDGRHVLAVMPTGSGKSLCFQLPGLVLGGLTIVVSPLVALMQDQVAGLKLAGIAAASINSTYDRAHNVATWRRVAAGDVRILYLSPERLMTDRMVGALQRLPVRLIAVDEAHCISQWGPAFRPEYADLERLRTAFSEVPIIALTATADQVTRRDIEDKLFGGRCETHVTGFDRPNIHLAVEPKNNWKRQVMTTIGDHPGASGIVYCLSRKKTEQVAEFLNAQGIRALPYHAGMDKERRNANQDTFLTETGIVMVATIAFGMGIDKPDIRFVIHTDLPGSLEAYYQEIGRAGRDGAPAVARMFHGLADLRMRRMFIDQEDSDDDRKRREHQRLNWLVAYCESPTCRRQVLLDYFGEEAAPCGACDVCQNPTDLIDGTGEAAAVMNAVLQSNELFGMSHIIDILRGAETEKIAKFGHDRLAVYGTGSEHPKNNWRTIIRQMVATDLLDVDIGRFGSLKPTDKGRRLARGDGQFSYRADSVAAVPKKQKAAQAAPDLPDVDQELLDALKRLRLDLARQRNAPAFVIFSDRTLIDMAAKRPTTETEFLAVHGVGEAKCKQFFEAFVGVVRSFAESPS